MRRGAALLTAALLSAACHREKKAAEVRPDWSRHTIDGIAPLMTPGQVGRALAAHGYKPSDCGVGGPIDPHALERATDLFCYDDAARGWRASLYFLPLVEGRRLAVVQFRDLHEAGAETSVSQARNAAFRRKLLQRFGKPYLTQTSFGITTRLWTVPGGSPTLPDSFSTNDAKYTGRNVEMTSF